MKQLMQTLKAILSPDYRFLYYMGNKFIVFLSLFVLSLFASLIEYFSFKMTNKNLISHH